MDGKTFLSWMEIVIPSFMRTRLDEFPFQHIVMKEGITMFVHSLLSILC